MNCESRLSFNFPSVKSSSIEVSIKNDTYNWFDYKFNPWPLECPFKRSRSCKEIRKGKSNEISLDTSKFSFVHFWNEKKKNERKYYYILNTISDQ